MTTHATSSTSHTSRPYSPRQTVKSRRRNAKRRVHRRLLVCLNACCFFAVIVAVACLAYLFVMPHSWGLLSVFPEQDYRVEQSLDFSDTTHTDSTVTPGDTSEEAENETSWCLILVNKWNPIPADYQVELTTLSNGIQVDSRIYPALQELFDQARAENIYPVAASGYRTAQKQQRLLNEKIRDYQNEGCSNEVAREKAEAWVAVPGTSEHQLGIAVDINADGVYSSSDEVYQWLDENAWQYGFIRRYPSDKTEITGVINEPWHYRYVGKEAAGKIQAQRICLEEYLGVLE